MTIHVSTHELVSHNAHGNHDDADKPAEPSQTDSAQRT